MLWSLPLGVAGPRNLATVIVFISSVRRGLEDERGYLPGLLKASGHEPRRFEDFTAQPSSSRDACLAGVEAAEVYLLLLGRHYSEPLPDTGKAPTAEEFTIAKRRGIPNQAHRMQRAGIDTGSTRFTLSERGRCHPVGVAFRRPVPHR